MTGLQPWGWQVARWDRSLGALSLEQRQVVAGGRALRLILTAGALPKTKYGKQIHLWARICT